MAVFRGALIEDASAEFRRQHQKLRRLAAELLAEFRGQARIPSMIAHSKTVFISIYRCFFSIFRGPRACPFFERMTILCAYHCRGT